MPAILQIKSARVSRKQKIVQWICRKPKPPEYRPFLVRHEELAVGGTAFIFRSTYSDGRVEIEKVLIPKYQGKYPYEQLQEREFEILKDLKHPLILRPIRKFDHWTTPFLRTQICVYEAVDGISLSTLAEYLESLSPQERLSLVRSIGSQLIQVLSYLQSKQIIHGDLAPDNILLQASGYIKLIDFGVARHASDPADLAEIGGRNYFRAPELRRSGRSSLDGDLFALGRTLEYLAGPDLSDSSHLRSSLDRLIEKRKLPDSFLGIPAGQIEALEVLPPLEVFSLKGIVREPTQPRPRLSVLAKYPRASRILGTLLILFSFTTWVPHRGLLTVNTIPASVFFVSDSKSKKYYETPLVRLEREPGPLEIEFHIPAYDNRVIKRKVVLIPGDHLKVFEDFQNLDTLKTN